MAEFTYTDGNKDIVSPSSWKHLYIMRHAYAAHSSPDKDRPLTFEGRKQLEDLCAKAVGLFDKVTHVLCSTANRTRLTGAGIKEILPVHVTPLFLDSLYNAPATAILEEIRLVPEHAEDLLVIAHNPGVSEFLALTSPESALTMGTAQIAIYDICDISWSKLNFTDCQFREIISPV